MAQKIIAFDKSLVNGMLSGTVVSRAEFGKRVTLDPRILVRALNLMERGEKRGEQTHFNPKSGMYTVRVGDGKILTVYQVFAKLLNQIEKGDKGKGITPVVDDRHMYRVTKPASRGAEMAELATKLGHAVRVDRDFNPILSDEDKVKLGLAVEQQLVEEVAAVVEPVAAEEQPVVVAPKRRGRPRKAAVQVEQPVLA